MTSGAPLASVQQRTFDLEISRSRTLERATLKVIAKEFWSPLSQSTPGLGHSLDSFGLHYVDQCLQLSISENAAKWTHGDVCDIASRVFMHKPRAEIETYLEPLLKTRVGPSTRLKLVESVDAFLNMVAFLTCMIPVTGSCTILGRVVSRNSLEWRSGSLQDELGRRFSPQTNLHVAGIRLQKDFKALNLDHFAGIKIEWTSNLADHLDLNDGDSKVSIFHHAEFLKCSRDSKHQLLSDSVVEETLKTLALLFPRYDSDTSRWYKAESRKHKREDDHTGPLDAGAISVPVLQQKERQIEKFEVWRDRLVILKQAFDNSEPKSLWQWWHDRRRGNQFATFWVAMIVLLITLMLGVFQVVLTAMQVYKAYHPG